MKTILVALAFATLASPAFAETRTVEAQSFHAIDVRGPYRVNFTTDAQPSVSMRGSARDLDRTRVRVANGVLRISQRCTLFCNGDRWATIEVTAPRLDRVGSSMGAEVNVNGVTVADLAAEASMGGTLSLSGSCRNLEAKVSMGGVLSAENMRCNAVAVRASMGGVAGVHADAAIQARASMGGTVDVSGAPRDRDASSSMGGAISID